MSSKIIHYGWIHPEEENPRVPDGMYLVVLRRNRTMVRLAEYRFRDYGWLVCDGNSGPVDDVIWYTPLPKSPEADQYSEAKCKLSSLYGTTVASRDDSSIFADRIYADTDSVSEDEEAK